MTKLTTWVSQTSGADLVVRLNKNSASVATATIPAGLYKASSSTFSNTVIADTDYITLDIVSGSGTDIGIRIDFT